MNELAQDAICSHIPIAENTGFVVKIIYQSKLLTRFKSLNLVLVWLNHETCSALAKLSFNSFTSNFEE